MSMDLVTNDIPKEDFCQSVQSHLQDVLNLFLDEHPNLSINGISKRCSVSEPTLRRIRSGQVKTLPSVTTIVEILTYISKSKSVVELVAKYPGPIAEFLKDKVPQATHKKQPVYSEKLNAALMDPVKYLIYKLAVNDIGVTSEKITELFGQYGMTHLEELIKLELIERREESYHATIDYFMPSHDQFVTHFKSVADFIKPHKLSSAPKAYSPIFANYSSSLNKKAYTTIINIQRAALKKIVNVLVDEKSSGNIPTFVLGAIDTLDTKSANEIN